MAAHIFGPHRYSAQITVFPTLKTLFIQGVKALLVAILFLVLPPAQALALSPLPLPAPELVKRLEPLLASGDVIYMESTPTGAFRQLTVLASLPVSAADAYALIADPNNLKRMSPSVDRVEVLRKDATGSEVINHVRVPFSSISTQVRMTLRPPDVIETRFTGGDLQTGEFRWQFVPQGPRRSVVMYTMRTDVGETSWVMRQMLKKRPEMQFGGNAGTGLITVWGLRRLATGVQVTSSVKAPSPWQGRPVVLPARLSGSVTQWASLSPLLQRGLLVTVESSSAGRLKQVTVLGRVRASEATVQALVGNPAGYPNFISNMKSLEVTSTQGNVIRYRSAYEVLGLTYAQDEEAVVQPGLVRQRMTAGDLAGSASLFEVVSLNPRESLATYSFYLDPSRAGMVMNTVYSLDPMVEHVMAVSGGAQIFLNMAQAAERNPQLSAREVRP